MQQIPCTRRRRNPHKVFCEFSAFALTLVIPRSCSLSAFYLQTYTSSNSVVGGPALPAASQKRLDDGSARFTNANFQEVSSSHSLASSKDCLAADAAGKAAPEMKSKKTPAGSHAVGQRGGRKSLTSSGKALPSAVVTMATPTSASTGPFHQGKLTVENVSSECSFYTQTKTDGVENVGSAGRQPSKCVCATNVTGF